MPYNLEAFLYCMNLSSEYLFITNYNSFLSYLHIHVHLMACATTYFFRTQKLTTTVCFIRKESSGGRPPEDSLRMTACCGKLLRYFSR